MIGRLICNKNQHLLDSGQTFYTNMHHIRDLCKKKWPSQSFSQNHALIFSLLLRLQDLQLYLPQLQHYKQTSTSLIDWIDGTRKKQDTLQAAKIENVQALKDYINTQKVSCSVLHCS